MADINLKLKSNHFGAPSTSLTLKDIFFFLPWKQTITNVLNWKHLSCKTQYGDCFLFLVWSFRPWIKNPVKRIFVNFGRLLRQLIVNLKYRQVLNLNSLTIYQTLQNTHVSFSYWLFIFYPRFAPLAFAQVALWGAKVRNYQLNQRLKDHNNQLSNRITIQSINKLGESSTHKRPFKFKAALYFYKTQWNYTQTNQLKPTSQNWK
jgi:hypothetical protein